MRGKLIGLMMIIGVNVTLTKPMRQMKKVEILRLSIKIGSLGILFLLFSISLGSPLAEAASFVLENQDVDYEIEGGIVTDMVLDSDFIELIVYIDSTNDGILQISFPRVLFDAKFNDV